MATVDSRCRAGTPGGVRGKGRALRLPVTSATTRKMQRDHQLGFCSRLMEVSRSALRKVSMLRVGTVLLPLFVAATARAEPPQRVLVVDTVTFSPTLEKTNARQKMLDAVTATVSQHGWQPVPSAECHDFTCVGPAAAAATANYALILTATFAGGDATYATGLGVSFWRDGSVVARRTEKEEQAEAERTPAGVFFPCGPPNGTCVAPLLTSKMQQYSARLLEAESEAIHEREVAAAAKAAAPSAPPVLVAPVPPAPAAGGGGVGRMIGWSLIGIGAAGVGGGLVLWAYDHSATDCHSVASSGCRQGRATGTDATVVGGIGAVAARRGNSCTPTRPRRASRRSVRVAGWSRSWRTFLMRYLRWVVPVGAVLAAAACSTYFNPGRCDQTSDCQSMPGYSGYVCDLDHNSQGDGRCVPPCTTSSDCVGGRACNFDSQGVGRCLFAGDGGVAGASGTGGSSGGAGGVSNKGGSSGGGAGGPGGAAATGGSVDGGQDVNPCNACAGNTPICLQGSCVECAASSDCTAAATKPICDATSHTCVPCTTDGQCSAKLGPTGNPGVCRSEIDGHCATDAETVYVQNSSTCTTTFVNNSGGTATAAVLLDGASGISDERDEDTRGHSRNSGRAGLDLSARSGAADYIVRGPAVGGDRRCDNAGFQHGQRHGLHP